MTKTCEYTGGRCVSCGRAGRTVRMCYGDKPPRTPPPLPDVGHTSRPGTTLTWIFSLFGAEWDAACSCKSVARMMDVNGSRWCIKNSWTLAGLVQANAKKRGVYCPRWVACVLVVAAAVVARTAR